jgi:outer membrane lipoprotein-sorting protein
MSVLTARPALRWLAPAGALVAVLAGGAAIGAVTAAADPALPTRSAAQLLVDVQTARLDGLSGTIVARSNLGLPELPGIGRGRDTDLTTLLSGTHTLRVWYSGPDKIRVALLGTLGETDLIRDGRDMWTWSSRENTATHRRLPAGEQAAPPSLAVPGMTPDQVARMALAAIDPSTRVSTDGSAHVAGRDAYELVLEPRDKASLVGSVRIAIDATEHVPLRVLVFARGASTAAIEVGFTHVSFTRPDPDQFAFNPPPGATVTEETDTAKPSEPAKKPDAPTMDAPPTMVGSGWTRVAVLRPGKLPENVQTWLDNLPRAAGGRVLTGTLFSVLVTDDGRILIGAVSPAKLLEVASSPAANATPGTPGK